MIQFIKERHGVPGITDVAAHQNWYGWRADDDDEIGLLHIT